MHRTLPLAALLALVGCAPAEIPTLTLSPEAPTTVDDLELTLAFDDAEAASDRSFVITWTRDSEVVDALADQTRVPADQTARDQEWIATVREIVRDEPGEEAWAASVIIANTAPVGTLTAEPTEPDTTDDLVATVEASDVDEDEVTWSFVWSLDGEVAEDQTGAVLPASATERGDVWSVLATPSDGTAEGEPHEASWSVENTAPEAVSVTLAPEDAFEDSVLVATPDGTDPDDDAITWRYAWTVDGEEVPDVDGPELDGTDFDKGAVVTVTAWPSDPFVEGAPVTSAPVTIQNSLPSLSSAAVSPGRFGEGDTVSCVANGSSDVDGDRLEIRHRWLVNDVLAATAETLDGPSFDKGDTVVCELVPFDGEAEGPSVRSSEHVVQNTPPELGSVKIDPFDPREGDTLTPAISGVLDADDDDVSFTYDWTVNGTSVATSASLTSADFDKGDVVIVTLTPTDGTDLGTPVTSRSVTVLNTAPVVTAVSLSPSTPTTDESITARVTASDADGDDVELTYAWFVDGSKVGATGPTLGSGFFVKGEDVEVVVTPDDGTDTGSAVTSAALTIQNSAPSITGVSLSPSTVREGDTLTCTPTGWSDPDGDVEGITYAWTVNGSTISATGASLTGADFDKGDAVTCTATPDDGTDTGTALTSSAVTVQNTAPSIGSLTLSTTTPNEDDPLSVTVGGATDVDGDAVRLEYAWYVNGSLASTAGSIDGTLYDRGDRIYVEVTPTDGTDDGTTLTSSTITAANTPPMVSSVLLAPNPAFADDLITTTVSGFDADGDAIAYTYQWYVAGSAVSGGTSSSLSGAFDKDEGVYVMVTPSDGTDTGFAVPSSSVTIQNSPPSIAGVSVTPSTLRTGDTATCVPSGWSDIDGDAEGYRYSWRVNGVSAGSGATLDGMFFERGDVVLCTVVPFDGDDAGTSVSSSGTRVANSAPTVSSVTISPSTLREGSTASFTAAGASDPDGDTVSYATRWLVNGTAVSTATTLTGSAFDKGDTVQVEITPTDGTDDGTAVTSAALTVQNTAPTAALVNLTPSDAGTDDDLSVTGSFSDVDGDSLTFTYAWSVLPSGGGSYTSVGGNTKTLSSSSYARDDVVRLILTVSDGTDSVVRTALHTVENTAPDAPTGAALSPSSPGSGSALTCSWTGSTDPDGDTVSYEVTWKRDSKEVDTETVTGLTATLDASETRSGDFWRCEVAAVDPDGDASARAVSRDVEVEAAWERISQGEQHTCGIYDGELYCWGANTVGELGLGSTSTSPKTSPSQVGTASDWVDVDAGEFFTCALNDGGELYCWGNNYSGQIGDGTTTNRSSPTRVGSSSDWVSLVTGGSHACAINTSGQLYCWGENASGQLGIGSTTNASSASRVGSASDWATVSAGRSHTCAVNTSGQLFCWGSKSDGRLGIGTVSSSTTYDTPERVGTGTSWQSVSLGDSHGCATTSTGNLYCWGRNRLSQLGDGTTIDRDTPTRVGTASNWTTAGVGDFHSCAINSGEELYCWGNNTQGQLGDGTYATRTGPVRIGSSYDWTAIDGGWRATCGLVDGLDLLCWGSNTYGQLGDGTTTSRVSPTSIAAP